MTKDLRMHPLVQSCLIAAVFFAACACLDAQSASVLHNGSLEIGVLAGDTIGGLVPAETGLSVFKGLRIKSPGSGTIGLNIAIAVTPRLLFFGQIGAWKGSHKYTELGNGFSQATNLLNLVYEAGFEQVFPRKSSHFAPYIVAAGATIQKRVDVIINYTNSGSNLNPTDVVSGATRVRLKKAVFAPAAGLGCRYYFGHRFGLRVEAKAYFPTGDVPRPTGLATLGFFVDFR